MKDCDIEMLAGQIVGPCLIDPAVGVNRIKMSFQGMPSPVGVVVLRRPSFAGPLLLSLRLSKGRLVADPRIDPSQLRSFVDEFYGLNEIVHEQRVFPRAGRCGLDLIGPADAELLDVSPYGARIKMPLYVSATPTIRLRVVLERKNVEAVIDCQVAEVSPGDSYNEYRLRFFKVPPKCSEKYCAWPS